MFLAASTTTTTAPSSKFSCPSHDVTFLSGCFFPIAQAMVQVCSTAVWNDTFSTIVGSSGTAGSTPTLLSSPSDVGFDGARNMYVVDMGNHRIQMYQPGSNVGTTVAGVSTVAGSRLAELYSPYAIQVTPNGTMFILDSTNYRVLRWQLNEPSGVIVAGGRGYGSVLNQLATCYAMFVDSQFNIFISDNTYHRIVRWSVTNTSAGQLVGSVCLINNVSRALE